MPNPYPKTLFPILKEITRKLKGPHDLNEPTSTLHASKEEGLASHHVLLRYFWCNG